MRALWWEFDPEQQHLGLTKDLDAVVRKSIEHDELFNLRFWIASIRVTIWKIRSIYNKLLRIFKFANSPILCFGVKIQSTCAPRKLTDYILCKKHVNYSCCKLHRLCEENRLSDMTGINTINQIVSEKLDYNNFHAWKFRIINFLMGKGY